MDMDDTIILVRKDDNNVFHETELSILSNKILSFDESGNIKLINSLVTFKSEQLTTIENNIYQFNVIPNFWIQKLYLIADTTNDDIRFIIGTDTDNLLFEDDGKIDDMNQIYSIDRQLSSIRFEVIQPSIIPINCYLLISGVVND